MWGRDMRHAYLITIHKKFRILEFLLRVLKMIFLY